MLSVLLGLIATQIELIPYDVDMLARDIRSGHVQVLVQEKDAALDVEIRTSKDTHMQNLYNSTREHPIVYEVNFTEYMQRILRELEREVGRKITTF